MGSDALAADCCKTTHSSQVPFRGQWVDRLALANLQDLNVKVSRSSGSSTQPSPRMQSPRPSKQLFQIARLGERRQERASAPSSPRSSTSQQVTPRSNSETSMRQFQYYQEPPPQVEKPAPRQYQYWEEPTASPRHSEPLPQPSQFYQEQLQQQRRQNIPQKQQPEPPAPAPRPAKPAPAPSKPPAFAFASAFFDLHNNLAVPLHVSVSSHPSLSLLSKLGVAWEEGNFIEGSAPPWQLSHCNPIHPSPLWANAIASAFPAPTPEGSIIFKVLPPKTSMSLTLPSAPRAGFVTVVAEAPWAKGRFMVLKQDTVVHHLETITINPQHHQNTVPPATHLSTSAGPEASFQYGAKPVPTSAAARYQQGCW